MKVPYRDANTPGQPKPLEASPIWGDEAIWDSHVTVHNPMFDNDGPAVVHVAPARAGQSGVVQGGIEPAFGEDHSGGAIRPPACGLRSEDQAGDR